MIAMCGLLFHFGAHTLLLASYCSDYGCFRPGCAGPPPNQCLPPLSDTYIVYAGPYYWATPAAHWRRIIFLFVCAFRNIVEPFFAIQAFQLMVTEDAPNSCIRIWLFRFFMVLQGICDFAAVWFWNYGAPLTKLLHKAFTIGVIAIWVLVLGPLYIPALKRDPDSPKWGPPVLLVLALMGFVASTIWKSIYDSPSWYVYFWEWMDINIQAACVVVGGFATPTSLRIQWRRGCPPWECFRISWADVDEAME